MEDWNTWKRRKFPQIKDWTIDHPEISEKHPNDLDYYTWFWFHPTAYSFINFGLNIVNILLFVPLGLFLFIGKNRPFGALFCLIFALLMGINLIKKIKDAKLTKNMTFYDLHLREYKVK